MSRKRIVFIGDSITESGRFDDQEENLGTGYVRMIRDVLAIEAPDDCPEIFNRGISGNRIPDLVERWQEDVIDLNPDVVSISIGINDVWRQLDSPEQDQVTVEAFEKLYVQLIEKTQAETNARIILMEPTVIVEDEASVGNKKLKPYVDVIHQLSKNFQLTLVPTHHYFLEYLRSSKPLALTYDGVHMLSTGNALMARAWLDAVCR